MKNLKLYEEFEGDEEFEGESLNELDSDQDFDVEVEFHEYINNWEKENAIPMTKKELQLQFSSEAIESVINQFHNKSNQIDPTTLVKDKLNQLSEINSELPKFFKTLESKYDWYNDNLSYAILSKIYTLILTHDEAEDVEWSEDDDNYMAFAGKGDDEDDDLERLRQISYAKYAKEDEIKKRKDEIFNKVADGIPLTDEELEFWKQNEKFKFIKTTIEEFLNEGEINWDKEKSWKIKDQFRIEVFVEKSWTGKYYVVKVPTMSMSYETYMDLDSYGKVDISSYDYINGEARFTSYTLDNIREWGEKNKDRIIVNYSKVK